MEKSAWTSVRTVEGRRRYRRKRKKAAALKAKGVCLFTFLFWVWIVTGNTWFSLSPNFSPSAPVSHTNIEVVSENDASGDMSLYFWERILQAHLPGMDKISTQEYGLASLVTGCFSRLTGLNFRDPGTILALELTGWPAVSIPARLSSPPSASSERIPSLPGREDRENQEETSDVQESEEAESVSPEEVAEEREKKILIYHSHITETFVPDAGEPFTEDLEINVAYLGERLVKELEEDYGIETKHHVAIYDQPRQYAYGKARPHIKEIVENDPDIGIVVDLHRDGISRDLTTTKIGGQKMGKTLIVVGSQHEAWRENFNFALKLEQSLEDVEPDISRGIRQQPFTYNQDLHPRSILMEIGGHENSLEEAKRTIPILAEALALAYRDLFEA